MFISRVLGVTVFTCAHYIGFTKYECTHAHVKYAVCTIAGCAPPVGAYDPKDDKKASGIVIEKSDRFKHPKGMAFET